MTLTPAVRRRLDWSGRAVAPLEDGVRVLTYSSIA